ncbi:LacI family DNA-binding transcriptional regulator [Nesterenkonia lutea]|uniref:LacI family transcriptional regulator n=1 Tax=Nesterenkonia lutea TaxID=272919 RepID=A0ABR9JBB5_9MICC|nr:LacI family DNA-binding transcriptional regulator [Nesterenkonia lutea]MBE1523220.1 LacI family transcriptional regulator [Nesterenkonia lutea]
MTHDTSGTRPSPTLEMVAAHAGVSRATVSRVVNDTPSVDPELVRIVQKSITELNYIPNRVARSLASRRTNSIAVVVPESTSKVFADPFFASVVEGIALHLTETDYTLNMVIASESRPEKTRGFLLGGNVDGVLVVSHHIGDHSWTHLSGAPPMVLAGRPLDGGEDSYYVEVDNAQAAFGATNLLLERGRRNLAIIAGRQDMPPGIDRLAGWRAAVEGAGLTGELVEIGDFTFDSGAAAMQRLLDRDVTIDAVFAANDQMAAGAYTTIQSRGLSIPDDVAVVGFDDDAFALSVTPQLTTVHHPIVELGKKMAEILVDRIEGRPAERVTRMATSLTLRDSV